MSKTVTETTVANTEATATPAKPKVNADSKRQRAFALLDTKCAGMGRKEACEVLMKELEVGNAYAGTIFQDHRKIAMKEGKLVETFRIQLTDDEPKLVSRHVVTAPEGAHLSAQSAVDAYVNGLKARIEAASKLKVSAE